MAAWRRREERAEAIEGILKVNAPRTSWLVGSQPKLLSTKQAAALLNVNRRTILNWIENEKVPYIKLPGGDYRIPLAGLLASLSGTYRLDEEIHALDDLYVGLTDEDVQAALDDSWPRHRAHRVLPVRPVVLDTSVVLPAVLPAWLSPPLLGAARACCPRDAT